MDEQRQYVNYFAYGSNLLTARIRIGVRSARDPRVGQLDGYKFEFNGYSSRWRGGTANIVPDDSSVVLGVVWRIDASDVAILDEQELGYRSIAVTVRVGDKAIECRTYTQIDSGEATKPSLAYKNVVLKGAFEHNVDQEYIENIRRMPDNGVEQCGLSQLICE